ncbi:MAG: sigma-70 family RNA polymerase sigma factor [Leptospirales bacterium]|jgi:RNA polymerase sigma-70 factor (ECF subfamily)
MDAESEFKKFHAELFRYLRARLPREEDAQDILQTVFLKLLEAGPEIRNPRAYLYQIARNSLNDYGRGDARQAKELEGWRERDAARSEGGPGGADPEWSSVEGSLVRCLRAFAERLPPDLRQAVIGADFEARSQKELAARFGLAYSSLKSRVQEARRRLRREFLQCCRWETKPSGTLGVRPGKNTACDSNFC